MSGLVLGIEVSNPGSDAPEGKGRGDDGPGIALGRRVDGGGLEVLGVEPVAPPSRERDDLVCAIDRLVARTGADKAEIRRVCVSLGPGGYTSVRVAYAAAGAVALGLGAELVGVPTWRVAAHGRDRGEAFCVCLASKGASCHVTRFDAAGERVLGVVGPEAIDGSAYLVADKHLPTGFVERAHGLGVRVEALVLRASAVVALGSGFESVVPGDGGARVGGPIYPREPDAVTQWRLRHGGV